MAGEELDRILNGLSKDEYARKMELDHFRLDLEPNTLNTTETMEQVGRINTLYGGPGNWPTAILRDLAMTAAGARGLSEGDSLTEIREVPYLTASSRGELEAIVAHDDAMPRGEFARRMMEHVNPAPKLHVMTGYAKCVTNCGKYDPFFGEQKVWEEYRIIVFNPEARLDDSLDPARAGKLLEAIDNLEAHGIKFDRLAPIATCALLKLSELANRGLFEHFAELEPYVDPRCEEGGVWLLNMERLYEDLEGQWYEGPENVEDIYTSSTLYYLPESKRFFVEERANNFSGSKIYKDDLWQMTREDAYERIKRYATDEGEKFAATVSPASIDAWHFYDLSSYYYEISSSNKALEVIAGLTAEFEPESAVKMASDGVHDLWYLDNIDEYILAEKADTLKEAHGIEGVTQSEAEEFKRNIAATLMPDKEFELDGVDIDQNARQSLNDIVLSKSMEAGCATLDKSPTERGASRRDNAPSADIAI